MKVISYGYMYGKLGESIIALVFLLGVIFSLLLFAAIERWWVFALLLALALCPTILKPIIATPYIKAVFDDTISPKEIFEQYDVLQVEYPYYYIRDGDEK